MRRRRRNLRERHVHIFLHQRVSLLELLIARVAPTTTSSHMDCVYVSVWWWWYTRRQEWSFFFSILITLRSRFGRQYPSESSSLSRSTPLIDFNLRVLWAFNPMFYIYITMSKSSNCVTWKERSLRSEKKEDHIIIFFGITIAYLQNCIYVKYTRRREMTNNLLVTI